MKVLLTGATGLIGSALGRELVRRGHELGLVTRNSQKTKLELPFPAQLYEGDLSREPLRIADNYEAVIHLLGEGVAAERWSEEQKKRILNSRVQSSKNLLNSFSQVPPVWIQASAVGYYGDAGEQELKESSLKGADFLSDVCEKWEQASFDALKKGAKREVRARLGIVLSNQGGALTKMLTPFEAGVGGRLGHGKQWMSWIHIQDVVQLFVQCLENEKYQGPVNFVAPQPVTNSEFSKTLADQLNRPMGPPVPEFALRALFGEMATVLMSSQKAQPTTALDKGYQFLYPSLKDALKDILPGGPNGEQILETYQYLPLKREQVFEFFSEAKNLEAITPDFLNFKIVHMSTQKIEKGTEIEYKLKVHGIPLKWKTLIEEFNAPRSFVDVALKSPYQKWHHTHTFEELGPGTLIKDRVLYKLPMGYLGWLFGGWLVKKDVNQIFSYRRSAVLKAFGLGLDGR